VEWNAENSLRREAAEDWLEYQGNASRQLELYKKLSYLYPRDPWQTMLLANANQKMKRWPEAYRAYALLPHLVPDYAAPWYHMALCTNDENDRVDLLKKMLKIVPDHTVSMEILSQYYIQQKRTREACQLLSRVMEIPEFREQYIESKDLFEKQYCIHNP